MSNPDILSPSVSSENFTREEVQAASAKEGHVTLEPVAIPAGYRLIPIEPTPEMVLAGEGWSGLPESTWADMIDAAPLTDFEISLEDLTAEREALKAENAALLSRVVVKALEWEDEGNGLECWRARPSLGPIYTLEDDGFSSLKYQVTAHQLVLGTFKDLATAKAAAQADYERRILSAISTPPHEAGSPAPSTDVTDLKTAFPGDDGIGASFSRELDAWVLYTTPKCERFGQIDGYDSTRIDAVLKALRIAFTPPPFEPNALPQDVIDLVIAAREFWGPNEDMSEESNALDKALEAFSSRVPYENQPDVEQDECVICGDRLEPGDPVYWSANDDGHMHAGCATSYVDEGGKETDEPPKPLIFRAPAPQASPIGTPLNICDKDGGGEC